MAISEPFYCLQKGRQAQLEKLAEGFMRLSWLELDDSVDRWAWQ